MQIALMQEHAIYYTLLHLSDFHVQIICMGPGIRTKITLSNREMLSKHPLIIRKTIKEQLKHLS